MAETPAKKAATPAASRTDARTVGDAGTAPAPTETQANPKGDMNKSTGDVGDREVIDAQEHVLGDDPRRIAHAEGGYHDSLSGRPVNEHGHFTDTDTVGSEGPVPSHRIVANNWPQEREKINDPAKRKGNTAV
jgi:hypothetical protein